MTDAVNLLSNISQKELTINEMIEYLESQDKALESILKHNKLKESNIDINNASESRIGLLIKLQYIPFSISCYNVIVSKAPRYTIQYISNNKSVFLNNIDKEFADYLKNINYITNYDIRKKEKSNGLETIVCRIKAL